MCEHNDENDKPQTVSESERAQGASPPSKQERDDAFSSGAGRKAVEISRELQERDSQALYGDHPQVGLDRQTIAGLLLAKARR